MQTTYIKKTRVQLLQERACACVSPVEELSLFVIILKWVVDQTRLKPISHQSSCRCRLGHLRKHLKQVVTPRRCLSCHSLPAPSETSAQRLISPETETLAARLRNEKIYIQQLADNQLFFLSRVLSSCVFIASCVFFFCFSFFFCRYAASGLTDRLARRLLSSLTLNTCDSSETP